MTSSTERRQRIHDLLVEELREDGVLESAEVVTYWMTLVATHSVDDDGDEVGVQYRVLSDPAPSSSQALGLMEWQRMYMQARITTISIAHDQDDE